METRLVKYLAECGVAARRKSDVLIEEGRVRVNGRPAELGQKIVPGRDRVTVDGRPVAPAGGSATFLLHKPRGYVTTVRDPQGRPTVMDLVPPGRLRLFPVGRLDYMSEGMLLLTSDGELALALTHPRNQIEKEYEVETDPPPTPEDIERLRAGIRTETLGLVRAVAVEPRGKTGFRITLTEGRKREIREMCAAVRLGVQRLRRVRIGGLRLGRLLPGEWRRLTPGDIRRLRGQADRGRA